MPTSHFPIKPIYYDKVIEALTNASGPLAIKQLAARSGVNGMYLSSVLRVLESKGIVKIEKFSSYKLVSLIGSE